MSTFCNHCGQYHESLTVCPNWNAIDALSRPIQPKLETPVERAELQISLLNALSDEQRRNQELTTFTLNRIENALFEQAETLKTYKLSLEAIQGLLVGLGQQCIPTDETRAILKRRDQQMMGLAAQLDLIVSVIGKRDSQVRRKPRKAGKRKGKRK